MKYVTFEHQGREQVGVLDTAANRIYPLDLDGNSRHQSASGDRARTA
jgi:hypothetical protein